MSATRPFGSGCRRYGQEPPAVLSRGAGRVRLQLSATNHQPMPADSG